MQIASAAIARLSRLKPGPGSLAALEKVKTYVGNRLELILARSAKAAGGVREESSSARGLMRRNLGDGDSDNPALGSGAGPACPTCRIRLLSAESCPKGSSPWSVSNIRSCRGWLQSRLN